MKCDRGGPVAKRHSRMDKYVRERARATASPKAKVMVKARARENTQERETATRTRLDLRMKKLDSARWVILVKNVRELNLSVMPKRKMILRTPRVDRVASVFCLQNRKSVMMDSTELPSSSTRVCQICTGARSQRALMRNLISPQEKCFLPLDVEMIVHLLTLEVLCPRAQWIMRRQCRQRKSSQYEIGECVGRIFAT